MACCIVAAFVYTGSCEEIIFSFSGNTFFPVGAMAMPIPCMY
jgi:hypothetical protein